MKWMPGCAFGASAMRNGASAMENDELAASLQLGKARSHVLGEQERDDWRATEIAHDFGLG